MRGRIAYVRVQISRRNEYTNWRPRVEKGMSWRTYQCGILLVTIARDLAR